LNLAAEQGLCEGAPKVKKERETPRDRILTNAEYVAIVDELRAEFRRIPTRSGEYSPRGEADPEADAAPCL